jgi:hypothetical protein
MTKLKALRRHLASLRRRRRFVRRTTAGSAVLTAILWILGALFALDVAFELDVAQRVLLLAVGAGGALWAFSRFATPFLGVRETETQLALQVEQQHQIQSDLVASLQFESAEAPAWGSVQLENAVIDHTALIGRTLNVFQGLSRGQMKHRLMWLLLTAALAGAVIVRFPDHAYTFGHRLLLGSRHYPSHTRIEQIAINERLVLEPALYQSAPKDATCPEHQPVEFVIQCSGQLPPQGIAKLRSPGGQTRPLELLPLTLRERQTRLENAAAKIRQAAEKKESELDADWARSLAAQLWWDAPDAAKSVTAAGGEAAKLQAAAASVDAVVAAWPGTAEQTALYTARLTRLTDPISYQLYLGDAWTDPAELRMIPLPVVEPEYVVVPPSYVQAEKEAPAPSTRQLSVLEGSTVKVSIECTNGKRLKEAWLTLAGDPEPQRFPLIRTDDAGQRWWLAAEETPFANVRGELRFEIQVTDEDGLHLDPAIRSYVRIKADRPPTGSLYCVHRVILPQAKPVIEYFANDDYGLAQVRLDLQIERGPKDAPDVKEEVAAVSLLDSQQRVLPPQLPLDRRGTDKQTGKPRGYRLDLATLRASQDGQDKLVQLTKGDRLKLSLEVTDYRGSTPGLSYRSEPLVLEVTDQSGFLAEQTEQMQRMEAGLEQTENLELDISSGRTSGARTGTRSLGIPKKPGKGGSP